MVEFPEDPAYTKRALELRQVEFRNELENMEYYLKQYRLPRDEIDKINSDMNSAKEALDKARKNISRNNFLEAKDDLNYTRLKISVIKQTIESTGREQSLNERLRSPGITEPEVEYERDKFRAYLDELKRDEKAAKKYIKPREQRIISRIADEEKRWSSEKERLLGMARGIKKSGKKGMWITHREPRIYVNLVNPPPRFSADGKDTKTIEVIVIDPIRRGTIRGSLSVDVSGEGVISDIARKMKYFHSIENVELNFNNNGEAKVRFYLRSNHEGYNKVYARYFASSIGKILNSSSEEIFAAKPSLADAVSGLGGKLAHALGRGIEKTEERHIETTEKLTELIASTQDKSLTEAEREAAAIQVVTQALQKIKDYVDKATDAHERGLTAEKKRYVKLAKDYIEIAQTALGEIKSSRKAIFEKEIEEYERLIGDERWDKYAEAKKTVNGILGDLEEPKVEPNKMDIDNPSYWEKLKNEFEIYIATLNRKKDFLSLDLKKDKLVMKEIDRRIKEAEKQKDLIERYLSRAKRRTEKSDAEKEEKRLSERYKQYSEKPKFSDNIPLIGGRNIPGVAHVGKLYEEKTRLENTKAELEKEKKELDRQPGKTKEAEAKQKEIAEIDKALDIVNSMIEDAAEKSLVLKSGVAAVRTVDKTGKNLLDKIKGTGKDIHGNSREKFWANKTVSEGGNIITKVFTNPWDTLTTLVAFTWAYYGVWFLGIWEKPVVPGLLDPLIDAGYLDVITELPLKTLGPFVVTLLLVLVMYITQRDKSTTWQGVDSLPPVQKFIGFIMLYSVVFVFLNALTDITKATLYIIGTIALYPILKAIVKPFLEDFKKLFPLATGMLSQKLISGGTKKEGEGKEDIFTNFIMGFIDLIFRYFFIFAFIPALVTGGVIGKGGSFFFNFLNMILAIPISVAPIPMLEASGAFNAALIASISVLLILLFRYVYSLGGIAGIFILFFVTSSVAFATGVAASGNDGNLPSPYDSSSGSQASGEGGSQLSMFGSVKEGFNNIMLMMTNPSLWYERNFGVNQTELIEEGEQKSKKALEFTKVEVVPAQLIADSTGYINVHLANQGSRQAENLVVSAKVYDYFAQYGNSYNCDDKTTLPDKKYDPKPTCRFPKRDFNLRTITGDVGVTDENLNFNEEKECTAQILSYTDGEDNKKYNEIIMCWEEIDNSKTSSKIYPGQSLSTGFEIKTPNCHGGPFPVELTASYSYEVDSLYTLAIMDRDRYDELARVKELDLREIKSQSTEGPVKLTIRTITLDQPLREPESNEITLFFSLINNDEKSSAKEITMAVTIPEGLKKKSCSGDSPDEPKQSMLEDNNDGTFKVAFKWEYPRADGSTRPSYEPIYVLDELKKTEFFSCKFTTTDIPTEKTFTIKATAKYRYEKVEKKDVRIELTPGTIKCVSKKTWFTMDDDGREAYAEELAGKII